MSVVSNPASRPSPLSVPHCTPKLRCYPGFVFLVDFHKLLRKLFLRKTREGVLEPSELLITCIHAIEVHPAPQLDGKNGPLILAHDPAFHQHCLTVIVITGELRLAEHIMVGCTHEGCHLASPYKVVILVSRTAVLRIGDFTSCFMLFVKCTKLSGNRLKFHGQEAAIWMGPLDVIHGKAEVGTST